MKNGNNYQAKRGAPDGECCVEKMSITNSVGEARNEKEERQVYAEEHRKGRGSGVRNENEVRRKRRL